MTDPTKELAFQGEVTAQMGAAAGWYNYQSEKIVDPAPIRQGSSSFL